MTAADNRAASPLALAILLAALAAIAPFTIDTYLPSFPEVGAALHASPIEVQQTLSFYLLAYALMALWHGAISDALGRRSVVLWTLALYALISLAAACVTAIEQLWLLRIGQGIVAGAGTVVGRAVVRDLFDGPAAQRLMSHVAMTFAIAPAIAPVIGGWLHTWFGWRSVFVFLALVGVVLLLACWRWLPESLPVAQRQSLRPAYLARSYGQALTSLPFIGATLAVGLNFVGFFIYVLAAPVFLMRLLGASEREFLWLFGPAMSGLMLGSWISSRVAGYLSRRLTVLWAYGIMTLAALVNLGINLALPPGLPQSVAPIFIYTIGMSLAMPSLTLAGLDLFPEQRGLASSVQTFLQSATSAVIAGLLVPLLWSSTLTMALGMAGLLGAGAVCTGIYALTVRGKSARP